MTLRLSIALMVLAILGTTIAYYILADTPDFHRIELEVVAEAPVELEFFYDTGGGFNPTNRKYRQIETTDQPVVFSFCLPTKPGLRMLRLDPSKGSNQMRIVAITMFYFGTHRYNVPLEAVAPFHQIETHRIEKQGLTFATAPEADDPIFHITDFGQPPKIATVGLTIQALLWGAAAALIFVLIRCGHRFFFLGLRPW